MSFVRWRRVAGFFRFPFACTGRVCYNSGVVDELNVTNPDEIQLALDEQWMRVALEQAAKAAELGEVPVGAVAVLDGRIIGQGYNRKESDQDPTAHAEMIALKETAVAVQNWRLLGVTLYCTLEPCPMCAGAMIQARLPRLVYGAKDVRFGAHDSIVNVLDETRFNHRVSITSGVLEAEAADLLQQFFQMLRNGKR